MGLMRFIVSPPDRITPEMAQQAYISGIDRIPWRGRVQMADGQLAVERSVADSGNLFVPWNIEGRGVVTLSTGSLVEREMPYHLPLELARGKVGQVRNQLADWQAIGLLVPNEVNQKVAEAMQLLGKAVIAEHDLTQSAESAERALAVAVDAADCLGTCYAEQALSVRRRASQKLGTFLGGDLGVSLLDEPTARQFVQTFSAACVPMAWHDVETSEGNYCWDVCDRQIEWCHANRLKVCGGPLIQFDRRSLPDWIYLCEDDFDSLLSFADEFIQTAVERYRGRVDLWICAGRVNTADILSLTEEEKVRLAARAVELTHTLDPAAPTIVSFDQPWAEYLSNRDLDFPPLHFADALVRADLGLSGLMLEINVGYQPGGTMTRDLLDFSRQLDYWSLLGVPLFLSLSAPSGDQADPLAHLANRRPPSGSSPRTQQAWASHYIPLLVAKPYVQGILWNQLRDTQPHDYPHGGLFDLRRHPKPALRTLASIRQAHLK
jgi:hypothetical protein